MLPNDASYEIRSIPDNTVLVQGLYLGQDFTRFMELLDQFELLSEYIIKTDSLKKLDIKIRHYKLFWLYEMKLESRVSIVMMEDILDRYREMAQRIFRNHHQLINNSLRFNNSRL